MTHYIAIDRNSGYVWGVTEAASITEAASRITLDTGMETAEYVECSKFDAAASYDIHTIPEYFVAQASDFLAHQADDVAAHCPYAGTVCRVEA